LLIKSLQISNIYSFEYYEDINKAPIIEFEDGLNIIIGPNGSGKSNLVEIINQFFKRYLIKQVVVDESFIDSKKSNPEVNLQNTIREIEVNQGDLSKNRNFTDKDMKVKMEIQITTNDTDNLKLISGNWSKISTYFAKYTKSVPFSVAENPVGYEDRIFTIELTISKTGYPNHPSLSCDPSNSFTDLMFNYLRYNLYLQKIIDLANRYENQNLPLLKNTFVLLGSNRDYTSIGQEYNAMSSSPENTEEEIIKSISNEGTKLTTNSEPSIFQYVKYRLSSLVNLYIRENLEGITASKGGDPYTRLQNSEYFNSLNESLASNLGLNLRITSTIRNGFRFTFHDNRGREKNIREMSSGEKGILHFIFTAYGYDVRDGLIVIDEPELHLHPKMHKTYLELLQEIRKKNSIQIIMITHSSYFIDQNTIHNTTRFFKNESDYTKSIKPNLSLDDYDLIQIISYSNSSKIFFTKKLILVEGPHDEYFYNFYIDILKKNRGIISEDFEILPIGGKNQLRKWQEFLDKFRITYYFVGDLDNITEMTTLFPNDKKRELEDKFRSSNHAENMISKKKTIRDKEYQIEFIRYIKTVQPDDWKIIEKSIEKNYANNIYILKSGELDNYLNIKNLNYSKVIDFCKTNSNLPYDDIEIEPKNKIELCRIFTDIMSH
jgi:predicted ATP-dependent endonuclease of OLD family